MLGGTNESRAQRNLCRSFGLLLASPALATDSSCQPVFDGDCKLITMPTHIYTTMTAAFLPCSGMRLDSYVIVAPLGAGGMG